MIQLNIDIIKDKHDLKMKLGIQDWEIIASNLFERQCMCKYLVPGPDKIPRESKSNMVQMSIDNLSSEYFIKMRLLPLSVSLDQSVLDFLVDFFTPIESSRKAEDDPFYFGVFEIAPISIKFDYKPVTPLLNF